MIAIQKITSNLTPKETLIGKLDNTTIYVQPSTEQITVSSDEIEQIIIPSEGKYIDQVTVEPLPTESLNIYQNGTYNVKHYGEAIVETEGDPYEFFSETISEGSNTSSEVLSGWAKTIKKLPRFTIRGTSGAYMFKDYPNTTLDVGYLDVS